MNYFPNFPFKLIVLLLLVSQTVVCVHDHREHGHTGHTPNDIDWHKQAVLSADHQVIARWRHDDVAVDTDQSDKSLKWITIEIFAPTRGYVGIGFSSNGAMKGSDIIIGWVDENGKAYLKDFHGKGNFAPEEDSQQDCQLLFASETDAGTTIRFKRLWETCDENDMIITEGTMRMIWAFGSSDPELDGNGHWDMQNAQYHGDKKRGVRSVFLLEHSVIAPFPDEVEGSDIKVWDITMKNISVETEPTTYFCNMVKFPESDKKHIMVGWRPILRKETVQFVHHITLYECKISPELGSAKSFSKYEDHPTGRCFTPAMPAEWTQHCISFLFVWLAGGEGEMFPEHVGHPLGEDHGGATYFMVEVHYDNPSQKTFVDDSGVRIFYTDKPRQYDGGILMTGYSITPFMTIPPAQPNFNIYGICSSECTQNGIPPEGVKIVSVLLHAHLAARKIKLRHIRKGVELPIIAQDDYYDFNYQQTRTLEIETKILPGDALVVECEYETHDRTSPTYGGQASSQEMCQAFIVYYPRMKLNGCRSQTEFYSYLGGMGIKNVSGDILKAINMPYEPHLLEDKYKEYEPADDTKALEADEDGAGFGATLFNKIKITDPPNFEYNSVGDLFTNKRWGKSLAFTKSLEETWRNGLHYSYCTGESRKRVPMKSHLIKYPVINKPWIPKVSNYCKSFTSSWIPGDREKYGMSAAENMSVNRVVLLGIVMISTFIHMSRLW